LRVVGERGAEPDGRAAADEHFPAAGDRPDPAGDRVRVLDAERVETGHRRHHHHERRPQGVARRHVRRAHPLHLAQGTFVRKRQLT
jgi:hypothetical protein